MAKVKYFDSVFQRTSGLAKPVSGASVYVYEQGTTTLVTLYEDDGTTTQTNPMTTDSNGNYEFRVAPGYYDIRITYTGTDETFSFNAIATTTIMQDTDGDTKVQVEEGADDDTVRIDAAGTEVVTVNSTGATVNGALTATGATTLATTLTGGLEATSGLVSSYTLTAAGKALLDDADATAQRATLGLGTIATQNAATVSITGGSITGITDLAIADGGTGASTAGAARTNLGLVIGTDVQAYDAGLQSISGLTTAADQMLYTTALDTYATTSLTSFARTLLDDADASTARTTLDAQEDISGATLTGVTVATDDKVLIQDTSDANNLKTVTAQSIADLASGGGPANNTATSVFTTAGLSNTSTTYANITSVTITPTTTSGRILINSTLNIQNTSGAAAVKVRLRKGASTVVQEYRAIAYTNTDTDLIFPIHVHAIDAPATTSATTYYVDFAIEAGTGTWTVNADSDASCTLSVTEV